MDNTLYVAMTGAKRNFIEQSISSNNLANATTPGFKSDLSNAQSRYLTGGDTVNSVFAVQNKSSINLKPGSLMTTGRDLDIAGNDKAWIAVRNNQGQEAYVKTAKMQVDSNGQLVTGTGLPVLGDGGPIAIPPTAKVDIGSDGTISVVPEGETPDQIAVLGRIKVVLPQDNQLDKGKDGLMYRRDGGQFEANAEATVTSGALESSNVSVVEQMVNMITANREFDTSMKLISNVDKNQQALAKILQM